MSKLAVHEATQIDARILAANIRDEDLAEIQATSVNGDPLAAILLCLRRSAVAYSVYGGDDLLFIGGVIPYGSPGVGIGWLLSTRAVEKHWRDIVRETRPLIPALLQGSGFSLIYNYVDVRYIKAICWLLWAGFEMTPHADGGYEQYAMAPHGLLFVKMAMKVEG